MELESYPEGEYKEMIEIYEGKGLTSADANAFVDIMKKYPDFFLDKMMVDELEVMPPEDMSDLWKEGLVTFLSFVVFGSVPLLSAVHQVQHLDQRSEDAFERRTCCLCSVFYWHGA